MSGWRFDGYKHADGCSAVHGWTDDDHDGSACPVARAPRATVRDVVRRWRYRWLRWRGYDIESSASRQHWIDTVRHLKRDEA